MTRRLMRSAEVSTEPPEVTAFCLATLSKICCGVMPSVASFAWLSSMKIFCGCSPMMSTLLTSANAQQPLTNVFDARLEFGEAHPVGAQHVDRRVDVAILVVEGRSD